MVQVLIFSRSTTLELAQSPGATEYLPFVPSLKAVVHFVTTTQLRSGLLTTSGVVGSIGVCGGGSVGHLAAERDNLSLLQEIASPAVAWF